MILPIGTTDKLSNTPKVTILLIALNAMIFIYDDLYFQYYYDNPIVLYLIFVFSVFMHADFFHLFFNMLFLWVFGSYLEDKIGGKKFLYYYFICEIGSGIFHLVIDGDPSIGASGAISGVMGIYLMRCHYSKIKTIVSVLIFYFKVNINTTWLMLFWILRDVYDGFFAEDNVAYWAHIGGYFTGIVIGILNNYWNKATAETRYESAMDSINKSWGHSAERDLLAILKLNPDNPDIYLQLARCYAMQRDKKEESKKYFLLSAGAYYLKRDSQHMAGEVFHEYIQMFGEPVEPHIHLKYAITLSNVFDYCGASRVLKPLIDTHALKGKIGEKIFLQYIECSVRAEFNEQAQYAFEVLKERYDDPLLIKKAESLVGSQKPMAKKKIYIERAKGSTKSSAFFDVVKDVVSERSFKILLAVSIPVIMFFDLFVDVLFLIPLAFILSFVLVYFVRTGSMFIGSIYGGQNTPEDERLREYNISKFLDRARACEREENYDDAIEYLKAVLEEDKSGANHVAVRHNIATLYEKLNQPQLAIEEYKTVLKITPQDHPLKKAAYDGIKELSTAQPSPAF